jgi:predicted transcriptional regulator
VVKSGLVTYINGERKFRMTQKGRRAMEALSDLDELMVQSLERKQNGRGVNSCDY